MLFPEILSLAVLFLSNPYFVDFMLQNYHSVIFYTKKKESRVPDFIDHFSMSLISKIDSLVSLGRTLPLLELQIKELPKMSNTSSWFIARRQTGSAWLG